MAPAERPSERTAPRREFVHPDARHAAKKKAPKLFAIEPITAFYVFFAANILSALFNPILDCDETFNYWEPTHYLGHGYGLQTWEYSPDFSIRSWLYISLHAIVANIRRILPQPTKVSEFYFVRYVLAFVCALAQTWMFKSVSLWLNKRLGIIFIAAVVLTPGNFHASTAFLPSSFAMYASMMGGAAFMNWRGGLKTSWAIFWFAIGGVVGWPFAAALCAPFVVEELFLAVFSDGERRFETFVRVGRGIVAAILLVIFDTAINTFFYRKMEIVPWNIVKYNIFSSNGGPNLYGTEPWTYYFKNLALNFNLWFVLALLSAPLFLLQIAIWPAGHGFVSAARAGVFMAPFYMWLAIFSLQPHKEERFMYPAYPFLSLNASIGLHAFLDLYGHFKPGILASRLFSYVKLATVALALIVSVDVSILRVYGVYSAYSAPLSLYKPLGTGVAGDTGVVGSPGDTVCFGKEWYRFPSSFFLPRDMHAKFVRSEFRGLLPGEFSEARTGFGFWSGTWLPTSGMNGDNEEDPGKYVDLQTCSFLVDTQYPENKAKGLETPPNEPDYVADEEHWEVVKCVPFLDAANTPFIPRALWVPDWDVVPERLRRKWGRHCLLRQKK